MLQFELLKDILKTVIETPRDVSKYERVNKMFYEICQEICCERFVFVMREKISTMKHLLNLPIHIHKKIRYVDVDLNHTVFPEGSNHTIIYRDSNRKIGL